jgi:hypothetical protein
MNSQQIETYLTDVVNHAFQFNLKQYLQAANRSLVGLYVDRATAIATPLFGNVPPALLKIVNQPSFQMKTAAAGYRVAFRATFLAMQPPIGAANVAMLQVLPSDLDVFLIASDVLNEHDTIIKATIFHETCHLYEDAQVNSLAITANGGNALYASLPSTQFRNFHTALFFDIVAEAAPRLCAFDAAFVDEFDLIGKAFQYDYEGDPPRYNTLLQNIVSFHLQQNNAAAFYVNDYLPKIDAFYRSQLKINTFVVDPNQHVTYYNHYVRQCLTLDNAKYQQLIAPQNPNAAP